jgi:hypothetical protein
MRAEAMSTKVHWARTPRHIRLYIRLLRQWKRLVHRVRPYRQPHQTVVLVVGAARSGTSVMVRIFERDVRTSVFSEGHLAISNVAERGERPLKPLPVLKSVVEQAPTSLVVMKPLADMHDLPALLGCFDHAKSIWMYRDHKDVVYSNLAKWGVTNGIRNLRRFLEGPAQTWAPGHLPAEVHQAVRERYAEDMNPYDAAALIWLIRNGLFFGLGLDQSANVRLCRYEDLIRQPADEMKRLYAFLGHPYPGEGVVREIHGSAAGKGAGIQLSDEVESLCRGMLAQLDTVRHARPAAGG